MKILNKTINYQVEKEIELSSYKISASLVFGESGLVQSMSGTVYSVMEEEGSMGPSCNFYYNETESSFNKSFSNVANDQREIEEHIDAFIEEAKGLFS